VSQVTLARNNSLHFLDNHSDHDCGHSATRVLHLEPVGRFPETGPGSDHGVGIAPVDA
jgi:hypothetical protein